MNKYEFKYIINLIKLEKEEKQINKLFRENNLNLL